jgi:hypothetical protein
VAVHGSEVFAVGQDNRVYKQTIAGLVEDMASLDSCGGAKSWTLASRTGVSSIAIEQGSMYGAGSDGRVYKQELSSMTTSSPWDVVSGPAVSDIAVAGNTIYGIGRNGQLFKQLLSTMSRSSSWVLAAQGGLKSVTTVPDLGLVLAVGSDDSLRGQFVSEMTSASSWQPKSSSGVISAAVTSPPCRDVSGSYTVYKSTLPSEVSETMKITQQGCSLSIEGGMAGTYFVGRIDGSVLDFGSGQLGQVQPARLVDDKVYSGDIAWTSGVTWRGGSWQPKPAPALSWHLITAGTCSSFCRSSGGICKSEKYFESQTEVREVFQSLGVRKSHYHHSTWSYSPMDAGWAVYWQTSVNCGQRACCGWKKLCPCYSR